MTAPVPTIPAVFGTAYITLDVELPFGCYETLVDDFRALRVLARSHMLAMRVLSVCGWIEREEDIYSSKQGTPVFRYLLVHEDVLEDDALEELAEACAVSEGQIDLSGFVFDED